MERKKPRWRRRLAVLAVVLILAAIGGLTQAYPSVAATTCPQCYGLTAIADRVYAQRGLPEADRQRLIELHADATQRVRAFYGELVSDPRLLVCLTASCYQRIGGGGERGVAVLNRAVMLSPRGVDPTIAAHELAHVELHERLGEHRDQVPQWFDEGLAVWVSDDPRYLLPATAGDRCRAEPGTDLPETLGAWLKAASADEQIYARAACRVARWLDANGGRQAVMDLVHRLKNGERFAGPGARWNLE